MMIAAALGDIDDDNDDNADCGVFGALDGDGVGADVLVELAARADGLDLD